MGYSKAFKTLLVKSAFCSAAAFLVPQVMASDAPSDDQDLQKLETVLETIQREYVDEGTPERWSEIFNAARKRVAVDHIAYDTVIDDMLHSMDAHSRFFTPAKAKEFMHNFLGEYAGVGIDTAEKGSDVYVIPVPQMPAARAGVKTGDVILAINDESVVGLNIDQVNLKLTGEEGVPVKLKFMRPGIKDPYEVTLVRELFIINPVTSIKIGTDTGYVHLSDLTYQKTDKDGKPLLNLNGTPIEDGETLMRDAVQRLKSEMGPQMKNLILDLRGDSGGYVYQGVNVADDFLNHVTPIVTTITRKPNETGTRYAKPGDITDGMTMVVLVDEVTASAAEIIAGALQDNHRAVIMGSQTFGKASITHTIHIGESLLLLTTGRYYTPELHSIQKSGITPDIQVIHPDAITKNKRRESILPNALPQPASRPYEPKPFITCSPRPGEINITKLDKAYIAEDGKPDYDIMCAMKYFRTTEPKEVFYQEHPPVMSLAN